MDWQEFLKLCKSKLKSNEYFLYRNSGGVNYVSVKYVLIAPTMPRPTD